MLDVLQQRFSSFSSASAASRSKSQSQSLAASSSARPEILERLSERPPEDETDTLLKGGVQAVIKAVLIPAQLKVGEEEAAVPKYVNRNGDALPPGTKFLATACILHVYDLPDAKDFNSAVTGGGLYHVGFQVYGSEWCYGVYGVCPDPPLIAECPYRCSIFLGNTKVDPFSFAKLIWDILDDWKAQDYDLVSKNCCSFAAELCEQLGVGPFPAWVNRVARLAHGGREAATKVHQQAEQMRMEVARQAAVHGPIVAKHVQEQATFAQKKAQEAGAEVIRQAAIHGPIVQEMVRRKASEAAEGSRELGEFLVDRVAHYTPIVMEQIHQQANQVSKSVAHHGPKFAESIQKQSIEALQWLGPWEQQLDDSAGSIESPASPSHQIAPYMHIGQGGSPVWTFQPPGATVDPSAAAQQALAWNLQAPPPAVASSSSAPPPPQAVETIHKQASAWAAAQPSPALPGQQAPAARSFHAGVAAAPQPAAAGVGGAAAATATTAPGGSAGGAQQVVQRSSSSFTHGQMINSTFGQAVQAGSGQANPQQHQQQQVPTAQSHHWQGHIPQGAPQQSSASVPQHALQQPQQQVVSSQQQSQPQHQQAVPKKQAQLQPAQQSAVPQQSPVLQQSAAVPQQSAVPQQQPALQQQQQQQTTPHQVMYQQQQAAVAQPKYQQPRPQPVAPQQPWQTQQAPSSVPQAQVQALPRSTSMTASAAPVRVTSWRASGAAPPIAAAPSAVPVPVQVVSKTPA